MNKGTNMKVYVVLSNRYGDTEVVGVFSSWSKANEVVNQSLLHRWMVEEDVNESEE